MNLRPLLIRLKGENKPLSAENSYELGCEVWGSRPTPTITWWKGSVAMRNTREMTDPDGNKTTSILTFVPTIDDGGKYLSCRGEQSLIPDSGIEDGWKLDIYHVPVVTLELGSNLNGSTIREGVDVYFECNIKSNPWVYKVSWRHNGKILYNNIEQGTIVSNQSLVLQGVTRARAGLYTCVGSNHEGDGESNPVHLDVKFAPVCRPGQPKVYGVARQETARITCELEANPQDLQFTWKFNNTADTIDIPQSLIAMDRTRSQAAYTPMTELDYGTLMCWGKNEIGMQKEPCVYYINPAGKPDALQNCTLLNQTFDSLQVECLEGFNGGLTQEFVMEVYDITQNRKLVTNVTSRTPYFAVGGLESGLSFDIVLFATNKKGRSDFTVLQAFTLQSAEKHTASTPVFLKITPILGALIGVITALLMVTIVIVCIIRMRRRDNRDDKDADENGLSHDRRSINTSGDKASTEPLNKELGDSMDSFEEKNPDIIPQGNGEDDYQDEEKAFERLNNASTRVYSRLQSPNNIGRSSPYDSSFNIGKTNDEITYAELSLSNKQLPSLPHVVYSNHQSIPMTLIRRNEPTVYAQIDMSAKAQSMQNPSRFPLHPQLSMSTQTHPSMHQRGGIPVLPTTTIQTLSPPLQNSLLQHRSTNLHPAYLTTPRQHHQQHTPAHQHHTTADDSMHITAETPLINPRESTVPTLQPLLEANASRSLNNQQPRSITATRF
ncbi:uncharacterized protein LOC123292210 isoform X2 [Chrysoperla carnea]|uniref:uncharacterized protein LOC123292210 isoform X2 n=1 Tax=Chrysoperla carnea TaxID=189513 RepID=UPI001D0926EF|nr:uncharacterized protein LOC123292210 isoform X2 [Chrysoperla carnea]